MTPCAVCGFYASHPLCPLNRGEGTHNVLEDARLVGVRQADLVYLLLLLVFLIPHGLLKLLDPVSATARRSATRSASIRASRFAHVVKSSPMIISRSARHNRNNASVHALPAHRRSIIPLTTHQSIDSSLAGGIEQPREFLLW